jgi:tetratricopeptide (TPR) repeat protein
MAAGFAAGLWIFIKIYKTLSAPLHGKPKLWQRIRWQHALIAAICIGWSLSVRILGLLLPFYFAVGLLLLFILNKTFRASIVKHGIFTLQFAGVVAAICMVGIFLGLCLYPNFFYAGPISHIKSALGMASHFQGRITMLWDRQIIDSLHLPPYYLIKSYLYTIPPWALAGGALFIVNLRRIRRGYPAAIVLLTLFTIVFPAIYIILAKSPAYNGWRHTCFIYSSFAAISAIGIYETAQWFKQNRVWKLALAAILALCMLPTARWLAANYKYASSYYNAFAGNPYGKYDLDPSEVAVVNLAKWLVENKLTDTTKRYKVSVKNMNGAVWAHAKDIKHVQMIWNGMRGYAGMDCDYAILSLQFLPHKIIRDFFPPKGTIRVERIDGMPIGCIVQKNPDDALGILLIQQNRFVEGIAALERAYEYDPKNFGLWYWMGLGYYYLGKYDQSIKFLNQHIGYWSTNEEQVVAMAHIGAAQQEQHKYDDAIRTLQQAYNANGGRDAGMEQFINANLALSHYHKKQYATSIPYFEKCLPQYPNLQGAWQHAKTMAR